MRVIILLLVFFSLSYAHQLSVEVEEGKAVVIKAYYPDGTPFSYEKYEIYSPVNSKLPYMTGYTDKNGRIVFLPDKKGVWIIKAFSQDGHGFVKKISIDKTEEISEKGLPYPIKVFLALSIILGLTGTAIIIFRRK